MGGSWEGHNEEKIGPQSGSHFGSNMFNSDKGKINISKKTYVKIYIDIWFYTK